MGEAQKDSSTSETELFSCSFVYLTMFGVSLASLCFGYDLVIISGAMLYAQPAFRLDTTWQSIIVGAAVVSATVSSMTAGPVTDKLGRQRTLLLTAVLCVVGPVLAAAAPNKEVLSVGRLITGITFPLTMAFAPLYVAEMSPTTIRGRLLTLVQLNISIGMVLSAVMSGIFSHFPSHNWRYMLGFSAMPGLLFSVVMFSLPESPRWLVTRGHHKEATQVLQRIYGCEDVSHHFSNIEASVSSDSPTGACYTLSRVVKTPHVLRALAVGGGLAFFFAWSGISQVIFFCGMIMKTVGFPVEHAVWIQGLVPLVTLASKLPSVLAVERYGRRPIVLISIGGSALSLMLVSVGFHLTAANLPDVHFFNVTNTPLFLQQSPCHNFTGCERCVQNPDCGLCHNKTSGFCLPKLNEYHSTLGPCAMDDQRDDNFTFALDYCPSPYAWIVVAGICLFSILLSSGMSSLTFAINAEIYPMWARSTCTSVAVAVFWISNIVLTFMFLDIVETLKMYGTLWFFAAMCTLGFVLLAIFLPETKNRSLEEVEELFMTSQQLQHNRQQMESKQTCTDEAEQNQIWFVSGKESTRF